MEPGGITQHSGSDTNRYDKKSGKQSTEKAYYITSLPCNKAARIAGAIRSHWKVGNQLHWVLDAGFNEDASMKRVGNAAENFARLRRIVLNLLRHVQKREGGMNIPLKRKRKAAAWSTKILECILFSSSPSLPNASALRSV